MEGGNVPFEIDNPRHIVCLGPMKKHVTEAARIVTMLDLGFTFNLILLFLLAPAYQILLCLLILLVPAVLTLLAVKNGNKNFALVPFIISALFFVGWSKLIIYSLFVVPDIYKMISDKIVTVPLAGSLNSPFISTLFIGLFFAVIEAAIYYNLKVHYILYRFLKEQDAARKSAPLPTHTTAPAEYQGSYQGYDPQPQLVQKSVY